MTRFDKVVPIAIIVLFLAIMGAWWWGLSEYRFLVAEYRLLLTEVKELQKSMVSVQGHVASSERVLSVLESIQSEMKGHK